MFNYLTLMLVIYLHLLILLTVHNNCNCMILFYFFSNFSISSNPLHMAWILINGSLKSIRVRVSIFVYLYIPY